MRCFIHRLLRWTQIKDEEEIGKSITTRSLHSLEDTEAGREFLTTEDAAKRDNFWNRNNDRREWGVIVFDIHPCDLEF